MVFKLIKASENQSNQHKRKLEVRERMQKLKIRSGMQGRVDVCVYKVSNKAGYIWTGSEKLPATLWQARCVAFVYAFNK